MSWPSLEKTLRELERTDPVVARAAQNYDRVCREILSRPLYTPRTIVHVHAEIAKRADALRPFDADGGRKS
jgi:hypothetical protein